MASRLLNLLTALSMLLSLGCAAAWGRSYWFIEQLIVARGGVLVRVGYERGAFTAEWTDSWPGAPRIEPHLYHARLPPLPRDWRKLKEFGRATRREQMTLPTERRVWFPLHTLWFPQWVLVAACSALPLWVVGRGTARRLRSRSRAARRLCPRCGYDLRASPARCPECGTVSPVLGEA